MASVVETLLRFKVVQLEGQLALYEALLPEIMKLEIIEKVAADVELKLETVAAVCSKFNLEKDHVRGA